MGDSLAGSQRQGAVVDFSSPVQGSGAVMYPLMHWRAEEVDLDFVLDVGEDELVVASDVAITSGGKGGSIWLIGVVLLLDAVFVHFCLKLMKMDGFESSSAFLAILVLASIPFCIWIFRSVKYNGRVEPIVFNRVDQTVTHYGKDRVKTIAWERLKPFIRIVRVVGMAGGAQIELLVLAEMDEVSGRVTSEMVVGRGDVISAGSLRYGFFKAYMHGPREDLPGFRLVSVNPDWMKRLALSLWVVPALRWRWLGEKSWSPLTGLATVFNTVVALPLLIAELVAARISVAPRGESSLGPWHKRFDALAPESLLRKLARHHGEVVVEAKPWLLASIVIGCVFWSALLVLFALVLTS